MDSGMSDAKKLLTEKIMQADAIVIGGGSGLSSAAGYDHYHWSPALRESCSGSIMGSVLRWMDFIIVSPAMKNSGDITASISALCGMRLRAGLTLI